MPDSAVHSSLPSPPAPLATRNLDETRARAETLMTELGERELGVSLQSLGWDFRFDRARRRLGSCRWSTRRSPGKLITVSVHYAARLGLSFRDDQGLAVIEDVIRHEIAHAVDFERRGRSDHGRAWKAICRRIGADPTRLYETTDIQAFLLPGKYVAHCANCDRKITYYRKPSRPRACRPCCDAHAGGRYDERFRLRVLRQY